MKVAGYDDVEEQHVVPITFRRWDSMQLSIVPLKLGYKRFNFTALWCGCEDAEGQHLVILGSTMYREIYRLCSERIGENLRKS